MATLSLEVLASLRELQGDDDPKFLASLFGTYLEMLEEKSQRIEESVSRSDLHCLKAEVHALKSSSYNVGAARLGETCQRLESAALAKDLAAVQALLPEFKSESEAVFREMLALPESVNLFSRFRGKE